MRLEISVSEEIIDDDTIEPALYAMEIQVELLDWADDADDEVVVGRAKAHVWRQDAATAQGIRPSEVGDSIDQETHNAWCAVMDFDTEELHERLNGGEGYFSQDVLYIDSMQIVASHRGRGLGLMMMHRIMQLFGPGCGIAVIQPHPITSTDRGDEAWIKQMSWPDFPEETDAGARKLRRYWQALGFKPVPGSKRRHFFFDFERQELPAPPPSKSTTQKRRP